MGEAADAHALLAGGLSEGVVDWVIGTKTRFVLAEDDGGIVGHIIYETSEKVDTYDWLSIRQQAGYDVFSSSAFVAPERRGQGLLGAMRGFAARHFAELGYRRNLSLVDTSNEASTRANARIGSVPLLTLTRVRLGSLMLVWQGHRLRHIDWGRKQPYVLSV